MCRRAGWGAGLGAGGRWAQAGAGRATRKGRAQARGALGARALGGMGARGAAGHAGRSRARGAQQGARPGCAARPVGCALGALSLFLARFDSVLFLSRFLDIVREPDS